MKLSELDKCWLACAIDGEGSIGLRANKNKRLNYARFTVANTNYDFIKKVSDLTGGKISEYKATEGHIGKKKIYTVTIYRHMMVRCILKQILKYMIIKKVKTRAVINYIENREWKKYGERVKK